MGRKRNKNPSTHISVRLNKDKLPDREVMRILSVLPDSISISEFIKYAITNCPVPLEPGNLYNNSPAVMCDDVDDAPIREQNYENTGQIKEPEAAKEAEQVKESPKASEPTKKPPKITEQIRESEIPTVSEQLKESPKETKQTDTDELDVSNVEVTPDKAGDFFDRFGDFFNKPLKTE